MSTLFDHVAKALGEPKNLELLVTSADAMNRLQAVRWSVAATRQMLDTMAELASDPATVGAVQRNLALVARGDGDGPIRLVSGRFEAAGASLVRTLADNGGPVGLDASYADNPLAAPVAWILARVICQHGPQVADPQALALFLERERRRSIDPAPAKPVAIPPPSHRSTVPARVPAPAPAPAAAPAPTELLAAEPRPVEPSRPDQSGPDRSTSEPSSPDPSSPDPSSPDQSDEEVSSDDSTQGRSPTTVFAGYMLLVGVILWALSAVLGANDLNIVLVDGVATAAGTGSPSTTILPRFAPVATLPTVTLPTPTLPAPSLPQVDLPAPEAPQFIDMTALVDIPFTLAGPPGSTGATGVAHIELDPEENQICHRFEVDGIAEPFGRLGIGRSDAQAGVVVDLGLLESGQRSCTRVSSTAMTALIAAETDHFVEVGDARRAQVVRGQTSASQGGDTVDGQNVGADAPVDGTAGDPAIDPSIAAAALIARPGALTLVGAAPDQATADLLRSELAVLDGAGVRVIDELTVERTAAPPTGFITVDRTDLFAVDLHDLSSDGEIVVRELALLFLGNPDWAITVSGHTDSTGDEMNNLELGLRRATEVRDILIAEGVPAERITAEGIGAPNPIADNDTPEGRALNRRFEIEIRRP